MRVSDMADPIPYKRSYSFTNYQADEPAKPLPGNRVDIELDNIAQRSADLTNRVNSVWDVDLNMEAVEAVAEEIDKVVYVADNMGEIREIADKVDDISPRIDQANSMFLGAHAADPTTGPEGAALVVGATYYNTTEQESRVWTGTAWVQVVEVVVDGSPTSFARKFDTRGALANAMAQGLPAGTLVIVYGVLAIIDPTATGARSAMHDYGINGVRLMGNIVHFRWWTNDYPEGDVSWLINAANTYADAHFGIGGAASRTSCTLLLEGRLNIASRVVLGPTLSGSVRTFNVDAKAAHFNVITGGDLAANGDICAIQIRHCHRGNVTMGQIYCNHLCGGIEVLRSSNAIFDGMSINLFRWRGLWVRGNAKGADDGTCAGSTFINVTGVEISNGEPEFGDSDNFQATGIRNESHDVRFVTAHIGWCGLPIHNLAGSCEWISCHPFNGNATSSGPRQHPMAFLNEGNSGVNIYNMYGDNGYIIDLEGGLRIDGLQMLDYNSVMTQPFVRVCTSGVGGYLGQVVNSMVRIGYFTGSYPVEMFRGRVSVGSLTTDPNMPVVPPTADYWGGIHETWRQKVEIIASTSTPDYSVVKRGQAAGQKIVYRYRASAHADNADYTQVSYGQRRMSVQGGPSGYGEISIYPNAMVGISSAPGAERPLLLYADDEERVRIQAGGNVRPSTDNTQNLGLSNYRWAQVYAGNGTINTSDAREKTDVSSEIPAAALDAIDEVPIVTFRWLAAIQDKGEDARTHFGVISQEIRDAFARHGLDAHDYGLFCYDEWEEQPEVLNEDGTVSIPYAPGGNRFGVRMDQVLALKLAAMERKLAALD